MKTLLGALSLILLATMVIGFFSCGDDDDDDDAQGESATWDDVETLHEKCTGFWAMAADCFQTSTTDKSQQTCEVFTDWETQVEDSSCTQTAGESYFDCLRAIECDAYKDLESLIAAADQCETQLQQDMTDCSEGNDDDDDDLGSEDPPDDDDDDDTTAGCDLFFDDFSSYPTDDYVKDPWITQDGNFLIEDFEGDYGNVMNVEGELMTFNPGTALAPFAKTSQDIRATFEIYFYNESDFHINIMQFGSDYQNYEAEAQLNFTLDSSNETGKIQMYDNTSQTFVDCATKDMRDWMTLEIDVDWSGKTASLLIDSAATPCADLPFMIGNGYPLAGLGIRELANDEQAVGFSLDNLCIKSAAAAK